MKVILLEDIDKIGKKYDIKTVKDGYARNFLIPNKLVKAATKSAILSIKELKQKETKKNEERLVQIQESASELDGQEIEFFVKIGEDNQLFEAITPLKIAKKLKEIGFEIKKDQIILDKPIKELGEFSVKINLDHQLEAKILLIVEPEEEEDSSKEE
ncbi:MAG: 50S ribosomal protein L9 [Patescibacteria group bacterium]|nr:50S ribosomal protein L9 [Patescibacteria group bacterium]